MATKTNTCETSLAGGSNVTTGNSAFPNAWNAVTPITQTEGVYYTSQYLAHGTRAIKMQTGNTAATAYVQWTTDGTNEQYVRINYYHQAAVASNGRLIQFGNTAGSCLDLEIRTDNKMRVRNAFSANQHETPALVPGNWYRIEMYGNFLESGGSSKLRIYTGYDTYNLFDTFDSNADETLRGTPTYLRFGIIDANANRLVFMDDFELRQDHFPGPVNPPAVVPTATDPMYRPTTYGKKAQIRTIGLDTSTTYTYTYAVRSGVPGVTLGPSNITLTPSSTDCVVSLTSNPSGYKNTAVIRCQVTDTVGGGSTNVDHVVEFFNDNRTNLTGTWKPAHKVDPALSVVENPLPVIIEPDPPVDTEPPRTNLPNFTIVHDTTFDTPVAEGSFKSVYTRWDCYPKEYWTTHGGNAGAQNGDHYAGQQNISVADGYLTMRLYREAPGTCLIASNPKGTGHAVGACPEPLLGPSGTTKGQLYGRYEIKYRIRGGAPDWECAWLLWPTSEQWPRDGENDIREGSTNVGAGVNVNYHNMNGTSAGDQQQFHYPPGTNDGAWHILAVEWTPTAIRYYSDGVLFATVTSRIHSTPMRLAIQTETKQSGVQPGAAPATAYVDLRYVTVYSYTP